MSIKSALQILSLFKKVEFLGTEKRPFWTPVAPKRDMMWNEILRPLSFSTLRIFYVKMATTEGGGGSAYP